eukprot:scaffold222938_cov30-Tisochrysis_lutea.AAC.3
MLTSNIARQCHLCRRPCAHGALCSAIHLNEMLERRWSEAFAKVAAMASSSICRHPAVGLQLSGVIIGCQFFAWPLVLCSEDSLGLFGWPAGAVSIRKADRSIHTAVGKACW